MLGSIAFVKEKLLAGGMCYLAGGVLSVSLHCICSIAGRIMPMVSLFELLVSQSVQIDFG